MGYTYTKGVYPKGLTIVGVPFACGNEAKRKQLLMELNEAFGFDSWVKKRIGNLIFITADDNLNKKK